MKKIGEVAKQLSISVDTLRYYEKIQLMPRVQRNGSGVRFYSDRDLSCVRFIKRAQKMGFSLDEITQLLIFRENPQQAKPKVRKLAQEKLQDIDAHLAELVTLRDELQLLTSLCGASDDGCPILDSMEGLGSVEEKK
ncbi:MAG: heavy metal-responsive transcriptional regulator [Pseudomonadales bacterium]